MHLYELNEDRTDYQELARFPAKKNAFHGAEPFGFVEAYGRLWINGYNITEVSRDLVGQLVLVGLGDVDDDGQLSVADINTMSAAVRAGDSLPIYDLDLSGTVDQTDRRIWAHDLMHVYFGDANLDGRFSSDDMVAVFLAGEYEDQTVGNSTWSTGDWDGDGDFTSSDLVIAFQDGGYERGSREAALSVAIPEPDGWMLWLVGLVSVACLCRVR